MPTRVYKAFKQRGSQKKGEPLKLDELYYVHGPLNLLEVFAAADAVTGLTIPTQGATHPQNALLRCISVVPETKDDAPDVWEVPVAWESTGPTLPEGFSDVLNEPPEWKWEPVLIARPTSTDAFGRIIANSAGFPFADQDTEFVKGARLIVRENALIYDLEAALTFIDCVNNAAMTVAGQQIGALQLLCESIMPMNVSTPLTEYQRLEYQFLYLKGTRPHDSRFRDVSSQGWVNRYSQGDSSGQSTPDISDDLYAKGGDGEPTKLENVFLDGEGKPIPDYAKVGRELREPTKPATNQLPWGDNPWYTVEDASTFFGKAKVLVYTRKQSTSFTGLIQGVM